MAKQYSIAEKYIGSGYIFPLELTNGKPPLRVGDVELIRSSLSIILTWPKAQRFFLGEFGCRIEELIGEPNDDILNSLVYKFTTDSISLFEKRIYLLESEIIRPNATKINIRLNYSIKRTSLEDSFILPFYSKPIY